MDFYQNRPLVFAHRGARRVAPENTLAAFRAAREMGADGIELDTMLSADGIPVVTHDSKLERTTNGQGEVAARTLAELQKIDAGGKFAATFAGEKMPSLAQVLDELGRALLINIELKTSARRDDGLEAAVAKLIADRKLTERIVFSSFNPFSLWRARKFAPAVPRGLLYAANMPLPLRRAWAAPLLGLQAVHPEASMVDAAYMRWAKDKGYRVNVWTVNEEAEMRRVLDLGVDMLITDVPDVALAIRAAAHA